jgi:hypothetical protein
VNGSDASQSLPLVQPRPEEPWSLGTFAAELASLIRRLRVWHFNDGQSPVRFLHPSSPDALLLANRSFRDEIEGFKEQEQPAPIMRLFTGSTGQREACVLLDAETDRMRTSWLLADFVRHLEEAPKSPIFDYVRGIVDQLLLLPAWTLCTREDFPGEYWPTGEENNGIEFGRIVDPIVLANLESAQSRLLDAALAVSGSPVNPAAEPVKPVNVMTETNDSASGLPRAERNALKAEALALRMSEEEGNPLGNATDEEVFEWLNDHHADPRVKPYLPHSLAAFKAALGRGRGKTGNPKKRPAAATGKSVVQQEDVEPPSRSDD